MDVSKLRFLIAIIVVGGFLAIVGVIVVAAIFLGLDQDFAIEVLEEVAKVMAGFIGLIIGYYFSRGQDTGSTRNAQTPPIEDGTPDPATDATS